jgi:hypothetical protein
MRGKERIQRQEHCVVPYGTRESLFFDPPGTHVPGYHYTVPAELELTHRMSQSRRDGTIYSPARQCRVGIKGIRVPIGDGTNVMVALHPNSGGHGSTEPTSDPPLTYTGSPLMICTLQKLKKTSIRGLTNSQP